MAPFTELSRGNETCTEIKNIINYADNVRQHAELFRDRWSWKISTLIFDCVKIEKNRGKGKIKVAKNSFRVENVLPNTTVHAKSIKLNKPNFKLI